MQRSILHLDADAFFASVEQRDDPKLRGKPVAVGTGVVASCSYESRRFGVATAMRLTEARRRCPQLIVLPGEYPKYEQSARQILGICYDVTPLVEVAALDDMYLDLTQSGGDPADPAVGKIAEELRQQVRDEIQLSISIGLGTNKLVSRVATNEAKPGKKVQVAVGKERDYLAPWPTRVIPGIGHKVHHRLERLNVHKVGEVAAMPASTMIGLFGQFGRTLHHRSRGIDPRPVEPYRPQQSLSRSTSFDPPEAKRDFLKAMLSYLLERACSWLRFKDLATRGMGIIIRYGDYKSDVGRVSFRQPVEDEAHLQEAARDRFERLYQRRLPLRYLSVELSPLVPPNRQPELFSNLEEDQRQRLLDAKDQIRKRFGFTSLLSGEALLLANQIPRDRENFRLRTPCLTR